ncbi:transcriptional regulator, TetR family [Sinomicrobium oceani]|uniref:Transcriptional regulator, TetR family n=1 Tax=Sinomicrobium oceani TaxID=1150368 RepID=A0A1K1LQB6_9FLAO|nr:TetR family transcriptional regulator [Sinomicrobium oceani]SFW13072.1 transcriptional regulator, TetR family [Sinomicrobium oceani]
MELNEKQIGILKVAEKLFAENGYDGTSVRHIAREAGVNVAMISYYFGSKEKLLEALLFNRFSGFRKEMEKVIAASDDFPTKIEAIVALLIRRVHTNRHAYRVVNFEFSNALRQVSFENYVKQKRENYNMIEKLIRSGQREGVFSDNVNITLIVPTILGTYFHFINNERFFRALHGFDETITTDDYVYTVLTTHIQQTVKALLTNTIPPGKT